MSPIKLLDVEMIQSRAKALAAQLGKRDFHLPCVPMHDGSRHVEVSDAYYLVAADRDHETERKRTTDADKLLYWVAEGLTSSISWDYELAHRREGEDSRGQGFAKQVELLATLSPDWADRRRQEQADILRQHPFRDNRVG